MEIYGIFTEKGQELAAKLSTGTTLTVTKILAGSGTTHPTANVLEKVQQGLAVNAPRYSGNTAVLTATLTAAAAAADYALTELGVYAQDPDAGEILYKIYRPSEPVAVSAGSRAVLRFYLEETISADANVVVSCSPAGLLTEADFTPVRKRVELTGAVPQENHTVAAADLQSFLDAQPHFLQSCLVINVSGTTEDSLTIHDFHGPGFIRIIADSPGSCIIRNKIFLANCSVCIQLQNLQVEAPSDLESNTGAVHAENCRNIHLIDCALLGSGRQPGVRGINASKTSAVVMQNCAVKSFDVAVFAGLASQVMVSAAKAEDFSENNTGAFVWCGGTVLLSGNAPNTLGGNSNTKSGGLIAAIDGSLL